MSNNRQDDIAVRIYADHRQALKDIQQFTGTAAKEFDGLPKIIQKSAASVEALTGKVDKLESEMSGLPKVLQQLAGGVDALNSKVQQLGANDGVESMNRRLRESNRQATALSATFSTLIKSGKAMAAVGAGYAAGKMVFQPHMERMLDYDTRLSHLTNVSFSSRNVAGRIAGKGELNKAINEAIRSGGGTREAGLDALSKLMSSGTVSDQDAVAMLPSIMRGATASGAAPEEIADIGIRAKQNMGFKASDLSRVIDMAIKSGNLGGFELKDMAKWLPAQMAQAATLGMKGEAGLSQLLALNQAAITTAGSTDAAGNNVLNLLNKLNSTDTQQDFKKQGIDLTGSLQKATAQGMDPITAFAKLIDQVMSKDKNYQDLERKRTSSTSASEQAGILEKQLKLAEGTAIGKVLQDQQARLAFLGFKSQGDAYNKQVQSVLNGSDGTTAGNFAVVSEGPGFKRQQSLNDQLDAQNTALQKLVPALNSYWEWTSTIAREYPVLNTALEGGKVAAGTFAAGAGAASVVMTLLTQNATAASAALGGVAAAGGKALTGGAYGSHMGKLGKGLNLLGAGVLGWEVGTLLNDHVINPGIKWATDGKSESLGSWIYDATHSDQNLNAPTPLRNNASGAADPGAVSRALEQSIKANPIEAKLSLNFTMDDNGNLKLKNQSVTGSGFRLDTGPTMTF
jgi:hypothetical protein